MSKKFHDVSFLVNPDVETDVHGTFKDPESGFRYFEDCAKVSLVLQGRTLCEGNVADETSRILDDATQRALADKRLGGFNLGNDDTVSDQDVITKMRRTLQDRMGLHDPLDQMRPSLASGPNVEFVITPETRQALTSMHAEARASYIAPGFDL